MIVVALFQSMGPLINVLIFVILIFLIFAVMGMSLLGDKLGYCSNLTNYYNISYNQVLFKYS